MEKNVKLTESGKGGYKIEQSKDIDSNINDVGAPPLIIVVQGGKNVSF